jgi:hypothetical protein
LSARIGAPLYLKLESWQKTGSFKPRGVLNKIAALSQDERARGLVTASAGNHAQALAWAAGAEGIACTVVMPETAPAAKLAANAAALVIHDVCGDPCQATDDFVVAFYVNGSGPASTLVRTYPLGASVQRSATGSFIHAGGTFDEYQYDAILNPPLSIEAGGRYWVEIQNNTQYLCIWRWETAPKETNGNGASLCDAEMIIMFSHGNTLNGCCTSFVNPGGSMERHIDPPLRSG